MATKTAKTTDSGVIGIPAPNIQTATFKVIGTSPYVQLRFSEKAKNIMREGMTDSAAKKRGKKEPRNFEGEFEQAMYESHEGWRGINAMSFKSAMIRACTTTKMRMTICKIGLFVRAEGFDKDSGIPLVQIHEREPRRVEHIVRNANGNPDIRTRAMWDSGWSANLTIEFDADLFLLQDVANLLMRAGMQVGIGEGRASSKAPDGAGMGWGFFRIAEE